MSKEIEKAIHALECAKLYIFENSNRQDYSLEALDRLSNAVDDAVFALKTNQWIPIKERWPKKSGRYIVTYREWSDGNYLPKYDNIYVKILRYNEAIFVLPKCLDTNVEKDIHREILAWQSLPEPYIEQ